MMMMTTTTPSTTGNEIDGQSSLDKVWSKIFGVVGPFDIDGSDSILNSNLHNRTELIVQIFRLVDYPEDLEVSVAAMQVIIQMSDSPIFSPQNRLTPHRLYSILDRAGELPSVMESFLRRLEREETENTPLIEPGCDPVKSCMDEQIITEFGVSNLIRLQILGFLIHNIKKPGYNLAHYLLGFSLDILTFPAKELPVAKAGEYANCLQLIVELLSFGLGQPSAPILALDHPSLGWKCYELLQLLLKNPNTSIATANFLRSCDDFLKRQFSFYPSKPIDLKDPAFTTYELLQKSVLLHCISLDLHMSVQEGSWNYTKDFLKLACLSVSPLAEAENFGENPGPSPACGDSILARHLSNSFMFMDDKYPANFAKDQKIMFMDALSNYLASLLQLAEVFFLASCSVRTDRRLVLEIQNSIISASLQFFQYSVEESLLPADVLKNCAFCLLVFTAYFVQNSSLDDTKLTEAQLTSIRKQYLSIARNVAANPESTLFSRGISHASILLNVLGSELPEDFVTTFTDAIINQGALAFSEFLSLNSEWKTVVIALLNCLLVKRSDMFFDELFRSGLVKTILLSIRSYELKFFVPGRETPILDFPQLFLWRALFSFLRILGKNRENAERLVEVGAFDAISFLRIMKLVESIPQQEPACQTLFLIIDPVIKFLETISYHDSPMILGNLRSLLLQHYGFYDRILLQLNFDNQASVSASRCVLRIILALAYGSKEIVQVFINSILEIAQGTKNLNQETILLLRFIAVTLSDIDNFQALGLDPKVFFDSLGNIINILSKSETKKSIEVEAAELIFTLLAVCTHLPTIKRSSNSSVYTATIGRLRNSLLSTNLVDQVSDRGLTLTDKRPN